MDKTEQAKDAFKSGYNCAQAVIYPFLEELNIEKDSILKIIEAFGGGIGGMQETCGAFSAATAIIGYYYGKPQADKPNRAVLYQKVREAADLFKQEFGAITCRDILLEGIPKPIQCQAKVAHAVKIVSQILSETKDKITL